MRTAAKVGLGVVALGVAVALALRFGGSRAAKTGLDQLLANLPPGWAATHGPVSYDALAGLAEVDRLTVAHDGALFLTAASVQLRGIEGLSATSWPSSIDHVVVKGLAGGKNGAAGRVEIDGLYLNNLTKLFDPAAYPGGAPASAARLKLVDRLDADDVTQHVDVPPPAKGPAKLTAVDVHAAHVHAEGVASRQFPHAPRDVNPKDFGFLAETVRGFAEDNATGTDVTEVLHGVGVAHVGLVRAASVQDGRIGTIEEQDFSFQVDGKPGRVAVAGLMVKRLDLNALLDQLPAIAAGVKLKGGVGRYDLDVHGVAADFAEAPLITMDSLEARTHAHAEGVDDGSFAMRGLKVVTTGRDIPAKARAALDRFGMADFAADADEQASYRAADGHVKVSRCDFVLHGLGTLHVTGEMDGLQSLQAQGDIGRAALRNMHFIAGMVKWDDDSLTQRLLALSAAQSGRSVADVRASLTVPLMSLAIFVPEQPDAAAQVGAFLDDPKTLTITAAPGAPVSLYDVSVAPALERARMLGVTVKGN